MKRIQLRRMLTVVGRLVVVLALIGPVQDSSHSAAAYDRGSTSAQSEELISDKELVIDYTTVLTVPAELHDPLERAMIAGKSFLPNINRFTVTALRRTGEWAQVILVPTAVVEASWEVELKPEDVVEVLVQRNNIGDWAAAVRGSADFRGMAQGVPNDFIDFSMLRESSSPQRPLADYLFPWTNGQQWFKVGPGSGSWHDGNALDFQPVVRTDPSVHFAVLAAAGGKLTRICGGPETADPYQTILQIEHDDGVTRYVHLDANSIKQDLLGKTVARGQFLGLLYNGNQGGGNGYQYKTPCGYGTAVHLHFVFPRRDMTIDGNTANSVASSAWATKYTSSNTRIDSGGTSPPTCPTSGDVILYYDANYGCGGKGENSGYVIRNGTGWQNMPGGMNDQASSIRIRSGWSVKLFEHSDRNASGGWACRNGSDDTFWGDTFNNGVGLNDKVSSFEVFNTPDCGYVAPCPAPQLHAHNYVFTDRTIPFRWDGVSCQHDGYTFRVRTGPNMDSDGDLVVDTGEGSLQRTVTFDSRWDNRDLYWSVRAATAPGGAAWSPAQVFRISPNYPPTISFNTANGNSAGTIHSRDRNWTFRGTASDPEGQLNRIEWRCDGDNCGNEVSRSGVGDWTYVRDNLDGRNAIRFVAYDNQGNRSNESRTLDLNIDRAAPATALSLNNDANPANWPAWFTSAVEVRLRADDGATGRARSGMAEVRYRLDGGAWQAQGGSDAAFTVTGDGTHTVEYYATDNVGNTEGSRTAPFRVDRTPPAPPAGIVETHGVPNGQWQRAQNVASFTWAAASDAASGLWGYQFYFGPDAAGVSNQSFLAADPRQWTPQPGGVRTGTYYLRGRTRDVAGNWSAWTDLFTFRYDGTPPENPAAATHALGATVVRNDVWQRTTSQADFTWPAAHDEGSGVKDYAVYWGADPAGTSATRSANPQYRSPAPLCGANDACTGYLRLRSRDNVDNEPAGWSTAFVLRYDNAPPAADFTFSQGVTTTQTLVNLKIAASDRGSGLREMRLSGNGEDWTAWEVYADERPWEIPGISRQSWPVYLQVKDGVGLTSAVISRTIYLDVNPQQPRSAGFRLFDYAMSAGGGDHVSAGYQGSSTVGQVVDSAVITSTGYILAGGYQAGSRAIPVQEPGHDEFELVNGIFASGTGATTLTSLTFRMIGTLGEIGVPNNSTTLLSQGHQLQPGFLAAAPRSNTTPTPTPTPGPTPTPTPAPACEFPTVSINNAAVFTTDPNVTLRLCAPNAQEMKISNDGGFGGAGWESYAESKAWTLTAYGAYAMPRFVYVAYRETNGTIRETYIDDIILDPNPPSGTIAAGDGLTLAAAATTTAGVQAATGSDPSAAVITIGGVKYLQRLAGALLAQPLALLAPNADGLVDLYVTASDDVSGMAAMQISASGVFSDTAWEPYSALKPWTPDGGDGEKTVYARFRDAAGNVSTAANTRFALDTIPPIGGLALAQRVAGPDTMSLLVYLGAEDNLSGVSDMRISRDPAFGDAPWQPYTTTLTWPTSPLAGGNEGGARAEAAAEAEDEVTLYVQYRDEVGNVSETYSDRYTVDTTPPVVYVEVGAGETLTRPVNIFAYDELSDLATLRLSNDPLLIEGVVTQPYTEAVTWTFDDRRVVWAQVQDGVGNWSEPYPAYAAATTLPERKIYLPLVLR